MSHCGMMQRLGGDQEEFSSAWCTSHALKQAVINHEHVKDPSGTNVFTLNALLDSVLFYSCRAMMEEAISIRRLTPALRSPPLKPRHRTRPREGCWDAIMYADPLSHFEAEREVSARSGTGPGRHHFSSREAGLSHIVKPMHFLRVSNCVKCRPPVPSKDQWRPPYY